MNHSQRFNKGGDGSPPVSCLIRSNVNSHVNKTMIGLSCFLLQQLIQQKTPVFVVVGRVPVLIMFQFQLITPPKIAQTNRCFDGVPWATWFFVTPLKINTEPENDSLEDDVPFSGVYSQVTGESSRCNNIPPEEKPPFHRQRIFGKKREVMKPSP